MSFIFITGRKDPLKVSNERARIVKKIWLGDEDNHPADKDSILDLGDVWSGKYGQIKSIELEPEYKPKQEKETDRDVELTPAQIAENKRKLAGIRKNLEKMGVLKPKND